MTTLTPARLMARNYEKRFTGLNRFLEAGQKAKEDQKKRPPLHQLKSAEEVKKWIPDITREIEYLLQQVSGSQKSRQYREQKIEEFKLRIDALKKEHQRFVSKVRALDPGYRDIIPWQPRGYQRKRSHKHRDKSCDSPVLSQVKVEPDRTNNPLKLDYSSSDSNESEEPSCVEKKLRIV